MPAPKSDDGFWSIGVVAVIVVVAGLLLRAVVSDVARRALTRLESRFVRLSPFRERALWRYIGRVRASETTVRVPFRPEEPLDVESLFVPVQAYRQELRSERSDATTAVARHRRMLVLGEPGAGKSILLRHVAASAPYGPLSTEKSPAPSTIGPLIVWTAGRARRAAREARERVLANFGRRPPRPIDPVVPVFLLLRRFARTSATLEEALSARLAESECSNPTGYLRFLAKRGRLLVLLDGLDEVPTADRAAVVDQINDFTKLNPLARLVVSCRTAVYQRGAVDVDAVYALASFNATDMRQFLAAWPSPFLSPATADSIVERLRSNRRIFTLAGNPLILTIIAHLYSVVADFTLPRSRARFYEIACNLLLGDWHSQHYRFDSGDRRRALESIAAWNLRRERRGESEVGLFDFGDALEAAAAAVDRFALSRADTRQVLQEIVERSGLLVRVGEGHSYQFGHLSIQEYFCASGFDGDETALFAAFSADPEGWREPVRLWCGLAPDASKMVDRLREADVLFALECVAEAGAVAATSAEPCADACLDRSSWGANRRRAADALGALAALPGRGERTFERLVAALEERDAESEPEPSSEEGLARAGRRTLALQALVQTGTAAAVDALATTLPPGVDRVQTLIGFGDVAVPPLRRIGMEGEPWVFDVLVGIGSEAAAGALITLLLTGAARVRELAALSLGELLKLEEIDWERAERAAGHDVPPVTAETEWVWRPFAPATAAQSRIVGAIASELRSRGPLPHLRAVDPRLVVPLCAVWVQPLAFMPDNTRERAELGAAVDHVIRQTGGSARRGTSPERLLEAMQALPDLTRRRAPFEALSSLADVVLGLKLGGDDRWRDLVRMLPAPLRGELIERLLRHAGHQAYAGRSPAVSLRPADWLSSRSPGSYDFDRSVHFATCAVLLMLVSALATLGALDVALRPIVDGDDRLRLLTGLSVASIVITWLAFMLRADRRAPSVRLAEAVFAPIKLWRLARETVQEAPYESVQLSLLGFIVGAAQLGFAPSLVGWSAQALTAYMALPLAIAALVAVGLLGVAVWSRGLRRQSRFENPLRLFPLGSEPSMDPE